MTDRVNALTVALAHDARIDDVEVLMKAIAQLRGVIKVVPHIVDINSIVATARAREDLRSRLADLLNPLDKP